MRLLGWILAAIFLASGGAKLAALPFEIAAFERWGYPMWFMYATGVIEVIGGIGLLLPRTSILASLCLALFMTGAVATHLMHAEWPMLAVATTIMGLSAWRAWAGRQALYALLQRATGH